METIGDVEERCKDLGFVLHDMNSTGFEYGAIVAYTKSVQERRRVVEKKKNTLDEVLGIVSNDIEKNMDLPRLLGGGNPGELRLLSKILGKRSDLASKTLEARETDVVMMVEAGVWKSISVVNLLRTVSAAEKTFLFIELAFAERIDDEIRTSVLENMEIIDIERRRRNDLLVVLDSLDKNDVGEGVAAAYAVCVQVRRTDELLKKKETMMRELRQLHAANEATIRGYDIDPKSQHSARRATEALDKDLKILIKTSNDMPKVGDYNNRLEKLVEKLNGMRYKDLTPGEENIVRSASLAPKSAHFKDRLKAWNDEINELNALLARSRFHERFRSSGMPKAGRYESDEDLEGACGDDCCRRCGRLTIR